MRAPVRWMQGKRVRYHPPDREWLEYHYWELDKSVPEIASMAGMPTIRTIWLWMKKLDVPHRAREDLNQRHSARMSGEGNPAWNGGTARNYQMTVLASIPRVCEWCGAAEDIQLRHRDHDPTNGEPENLGWLCGTCNRLDSQLWALFQSGHATWAYDERHHRIVVQFLRH